MRIAQIVLGLACLVAYFRLTTAAWTLRTPAAVVSVVTAALAGSALVAAFPLGRATPLSLALQVAAAAGMTLLGRWLRRPAGPAGA